MRIPIINIGNSKGIRIPQAILKQVSFGGEIDLEIENGRIILNRSNSPGIVPDFDSIPDMDDITIQRMLRKITGIDLITSLIDADENIKKAVYRNLSDRVRSYVIKKVDKLEKGDARDLLIEQSRNSISEAFMDLMND